MVSALLVILAATATVVGVDTNCAPIAETTAAKVERLRAELDVALTQFRLEKAARAVNERMRRKAKP